MSPLCDDFCPVWRLQLAATASCRASVEPVGAVYYRATKQPPPICRVMRPSKHDIPSPFCFGSVHALTLPHLQPSNQLLIWCAASGPAFPHRIGTSLQGAANCRQLLRACAAGRSAPAQRQQPRSQFLPRSWLQCPRALVVLELVVASLEFWLMACGL